MFDLSGCVNDDQIIEPEEIVNSGTDLLSLPITTAPTIDGTIDALWLESPILEFSTAVPEVTGDVFRGYAGNIIPTVKLRSVYDAENIYFLAEWDDPTESLQRGLYLTIRDQMKKAEKHNGRKFLSLGLLTRAALFTPDAQAESSNS